MRKKLKDPWLIGFLVGFVGVLLIGSLLIASLSILSATPAPTPLPSTTALTEPRGVASPTSGLQAETPAPTSRPSPTSTALLSPTETSLPPVRPESITYTVQSGDTLFGIASAHDLSVETLQIANELAGEIIVPGQVLIIPPGPLPTPTPYVEAGLIIHTVSSGETLIGIARRYSVTIRAIQTANDLDSDIIRPGWELKIPTDSTEQPSPTAETPIGQSWQPSILEGNLEEGYPLTAKGDLFTLHYQPDTPVARAPNQVIAMVESALSHIENTLQINLESDFDLYVAGTLFAGDDIALRGRSFSSQRRVFLLYDDTGTSYERLYVITHELAHLAARTTLGQPSSVMLHEGAAVYAGSAALEAGDFIPLTRFCAAYGQLGQLPSLSDDHAYQGHIHDLDLYFAAGCFTKFLIEEYGLSSFRQLFTSGDYPAIYGQTFAQLETDWVKTLEVIGGDLTFEPEELIATIDAVADAYDQLYTDFSGTSPQMESYHEIDQARIATLQGQLEDAREHLNTFYELLKGE
jgi:LysM repeat protein